METFLTGIARPVTIDARFAMPAITGPVVVAFGGGTDSTALLFWLYTLGIRPDLILFADTGGERPHTYRHIAKLDTWLQARGWPPITVVRRVNFEGRVLSLEENCLNKRMLPSLAYGFKSCSQKFKVQPQDKFVNNRQPAKDAWKRGGKVLKIIGYDANEERRAKNFSDNKYDFWYPLLAWDKDRDDCIEAIRAAGFELPGKSSCFFCPASTKPEIDETARMYPNLMHRALAMESRAELSSVKGLGRRFNWGEYIAIKRIGQPDTTDSTSIDRACGCYE